MCRLPDLKGFEVVCIKLYGVYKLTFQRFRANILLQFFFTYMTGLQKRPERLFQYRVTHNSGINHSLKQSYLTTTYLQNLVLVPEKSKKEEYLISKYSYLDGL